MKFHNYAFGTFATILFPLFFFLLALTNKKREEQAKNRHIFMYTTYINVHNGLTMANEGHAMYETSDLWRYMMKKQ